MKYLAGRHIKDNGGYPVYFILCLLPCLLFTDLANAGSSAFIENVATISAEQLIALAEQQPELVIIDSRLPGDRKLAYIEDSVSLPDTLTNCETLSRLLHNKTSTSAFYCNGIKCERSARAIHIALQCGYKNIYWFRGGLEEWSAKNFPYLQE